MMARGAGWKRGMGLAMLLATVLAGEASAQGARAETGGPGGRPASGDFAGFLSAMRPKALALGVSAATWERETAGLTPDLSLPNLDRGPRKPSHAGQREFSATPAQYLSDQAMAATAAKGAGLAARYRPQLAAIEQRFGVPGQVALAIFGRETGYGANTGKYDGLRTLATQAWTGRRRETFAQEFLYALKMLDDGVVSRPAMKSSWAGAMGLTQMLPSQYYRYGVDLDGGGRADIWTSVPDALASIANHLRGEGWRPGERWAYEVAPPARADCTMADPDAPRPWSQWAAAGYRPENGPAPARGTQLALLLPAGVYGPGFLVGPNYFVLKAYNFSDLYVLYVGHLADRIAGGGPFATAWGKVAQPSAAQLAAMQRELTRLGLYREKIDGFAGMKTRLAVGAFQKAHGLGVDCWPTPETLKAISAAAKQGATP
ncbi:lytic murein transglycosylase [Camelimonas fluminis]|uniref:Lytic murein transglycosylase n=1 Tax=Camelimonas fluminis TaxID=1576911 RepID=A0ABV7UD70_9HYPH|nr:lytic murein transglycosylase [Camelimonas fluminis]